MLTRMRHILKEKSFVLVGLVAFALLCVSISNRACRTVDETARSLKQDCEPKISFKEGELTSREKRPRDMLKIYDDVKSWLIFVGHSRTGHTVVGSLLDAHPEMIISDEKGSKWGLWQDDISLIPDWDMKKYKFLFSTHVYSQSLANFGFRATPSAFHEGKGSGNHSYNYHVTGQWQGQFRDKITVMGDKMGHYTAEYFIDPEKLVKLDYIQKNLGVSLKIIHVMRNPYDVIATRVLRKSKARDEADSGIKVNNPEALDDYIHGYFQRTQSIERIRQKHNVLDVPGHELIEQPRETMQKLCDYIGVTCEQDYIDSCSRLLYKKASVTRNSVVWTDEQLQWVQREIENYPFLKRYSFHSDP